MPCNIYNINMILKMIKSSEQSTTYNGMFPPESNDMREPATQKFDGSQLESAELQRCAHKQLRTCIHSLIKHIFIQHIESSGD